MPLLCCGVPAMKDGDVLGHEFMGEVVEVGEENTRLKVGLDAPAMYRTFRDKDDLCIKVVIKPGAAS